MRGVIRALAGRLPLPPRREALPLALLLLALTPAFAFGNDRSQFYRGGHHDSITAYTLTFSANLSAEHGFALFWRRKLGPDGEPRYVSLYHRFPIGSYALVKLATLPAGDDIPKQMLAARTLMLAFFAAAAVLAWLALARLLGDRRIALAATLLAFSSYYLLYYNDMVAAEESTNLFGVVLVFHGMILFAQEGRFRQLLVKAAVAIVLGWHVLALIAPFVLIGLGGELLRLRAARGGERRPRLRPYLVCGAFSVLCAALVLGFNLFNEYRVLGGEVAPLDLPTVQSLLQRTGIDAAQTHVGELGWPTFLRGQLGGVGGMAIPFALADRLGPNPAQPYHGLWPPEASAPWFAALGAGTVAVCLAGLRFLPHRALFAALLAAGWCWAIPFRGQNAYHEFEAMFYLGFPLVLFALALLGLRRLLGPRRAALALPAAALAAAALFALSAWDMGGVGHDAAAAARQREVAADVPAVRALAADRSVIVKPGQILFPRHKHQTRNYYLAGSYLQIEPIDSEEDWDDLPAYDFVLLGADFGASLTPDNRRLHLYRLADLPRSYAALAAREPALSSAFDLLLDGRRLLYLREECAGEDTGDRFFLHAFPADPRDLEPGRAPRAFNDRTFEFAEYGVRFGGRCMAAVPLPDYGLLAVRTGRYHSEDGPIWSADLPLDPEAWLARRDALAAREPAARSRFDVHAEGRTLTFVREDCAGADTEDRFFVHAYAPDGSREALDFWFGDRGIRYGGSCMARIALPDYEVRSVRTGQYDDTGHLWDEEFALGAEAWLARFDALAAREPDARRAGFALHAEGRTLTFAREGCTAADIADRFFVHVRAPDGGRENLDFWFRERGLRHGDRCMASVVLPDHAAARVVAGQYDASGRLWEADLAVGE